MSFFRFARLLFGADGRDPSPLLRASKRRLGRDQLRYLDDLPERRGPRPAVLGRCVASSLSPSLSSVSTLLNVSPHFYILPDPFLIVTLARSNLPPSPKRSSLTSSGSRTSTHCSSTNELPFSNVLVLRSVWILTSLILQRDGSSHRGGGKERSSTSTRTIIPFTFVALSLL